MKRCAVFAAVLFAVAACSERPAEPVAPDYSRHAGRTAANSHGLLLEDRYIIVFRDNVRDVAALVRRLTAATRATVHYTYEHTIKGFAAMMPPKAVAAIRAHPRVEAVYQDAPVELHSAPGNWGQDRVDQRALPLDGSYAPAGSSGLGVDVYVLDGGIMSDHNEFSPNQVATGHEQAYDAFRDTTSQHYAEDCWGQTEEGHVMAPNGHGNGWRASLVGPRTVSPQRSI